MECAPLIQDFLCVFDSGDYKIPETVPETWPLRNEFHEAHEAARDSSSPWIEAAAVDYKENWGWPEPHSDLQGTQNHWKTPGKH